MAASELECFADDVRGRGNFGLDVSNKNMVGTGDIALRFVVDQRRVIVDCISQRVYDRERLVFDRNEGGHVFSYVTILGDDECNRLTDIAHDFVSKHRWAFWIPDAAIRNDHRHFGNQAA